jgi:hypothetical protein
MNRQGQALIEAAAFFMELAVLSAGLCGFTRWMLVRQKLMIAVKQGALMYSSGHMTRAEVEQRMRLFLQAGMPALDPGQVHVAVRPVPGLSARFYGLDEAVAGYTSPSGWFYLLGADRHMEEKCVIMHAPHYWAPIQPWGGPAVAYGD